ncbi:TauD/TfdA family dioxygenase [Streptomyces chattanoogensis]
MSERWSADAGGAGGGCGDANENEEFGRQLDQLIRDPEHLYTHRWQPRDLVVWKAATTYHAVTDVEPGVDCTVHRISIATPDTPDTRHTADTRYTPDTPA